MKAILQHEFHILLENSRRFVVSTLESWKTRVDNIFKHELTLFLDQNFCLRSLLNPVQNGSVLPDNDATYIRGNQHFHVGRRC